MRPLLLALGLALFVACDSKSAEQPQFDLSKLMGATPGELNPMPGGTFIWGRSGDSLKLDPGLVDDGESVQVITNIFDTLVTFEPGTTKIMPWLATKWITNGDGLVWTFELRDDVKFHDGTPFNAEAVVFSFERQSDPNHPARGPEDVFTYYRDNFKSLEKVEAVDERHVRFTLKQPYAPFLSALALFSCSIVSPAAFDREGVAFARNPVGTGPFIFESWQKDAQIVLRANKDHFAGPPPIDKLIFKPIKDPQARLKELESGSIHGMDNPEPVDLPGAVANPDLRVLARSGVNVCYLAMNTEKPPFDRKRVRQAIAFAIDKQRIIDAAYNGMAEPAVSMCPASMAGYKAIVDRKRSPDRARALLAEEGLEDGFETELWYPIVQRTYLPNSAAVAIQLQQQLGEVGIRVKLKKMEWSSYLEGTNNGKHELGIFGWMADIGDPDNFLYVLLDRDNATKPGNNRAFYRGDRVHNLLTEAQRVLDWAQREALYGDAQDILFDEVPTVPLVTAPDLRIVRKNVRGYTIYPAGGEYFRQVSFAR